MEIKDLHVPAEILNFKNKFEDFYLKKMGGRKLIWHMDQGKSLIEFHAKNKHTMECSNI